MRTSIILATLASLPSLLALSAPSLYPRSYARREVDTNTSYCPGVPAPEYIQRQIFFAFVHELYVVKDVISAFDKYIAYNLTEHDPFDAQGRVPNEIKLSHRGYEALLTERNADLESLYSVIPYIPSTVLRQSFDNNIGFAHVRVDEPGEEPIALADIYRMEGTCIVEHWDVTQARPANATNPIAMF